jgi:hypothetical protein
MNFSEMLDSLDLSPAERTLIEHASSSNVGQTQSAYVAASIYALKRLKNLSDEMVDHQRAYAKATNFASWTLIVVTIGLLVVGAVQVWVTW